LKHYGVDKQANEIIGEKDPIVTNGEGVNDGIGDGPYDDIHRIFRNKWHQTTARLVGRNKVSLKLKSKRIIGGSTCLKMIKEHSVD